MCGEAKSGWCIHMYLTAGTSRQSLSPALGHVLANTDLKRVTNFPLHGTG